jgi:hypothetical protein
VDPGPGPGTEAKLRLTAVVAGTPIALVTAEVTGADIATPLLFNLPITDGVATGTIRLPPGEGRTIAVRAFDDGGEITHEGEATIAVRPGPNPPVNIPLRPRAGQVPITATLGEFSVIVSPALVDVQVGASVQLTATILDAEGNVVPGTVEWAVANPAFASVTPDGLLTGLVEGETAVGASYEGMAGSSTASVLPVDVSGLYAGTATPDVTGQVIGLGITLGSDVILGCTDPCPASLELVQTSPTTATGTISAGTRSFAGDFTLAQVAGGLVLTAPPVLVGFDVTFDSPLGTIVAPTTCTVDGSGGLSLDPTPQGLSASGPVTLDCSGSGGGFSFTASGTVTLDLVRGG